MMRRAGIILVAVVLLAACVPPSLQEPTALPTNTPTLTAIPTETATFVPTAPLPTLTPTRPAQSGTDAATFLKETYPDYSVLALGEQFVKTWDVKNTGTNTWNENYKLVLDATPQNEALGSPAEIHFPEDTLPGGIATLSVPLTAPTAPGTYSVYWKLENENGQTFGVDGDRVWVTIMVCEAGQTCVPPSSSGSATSVNGISVTLTDFTTTSQGAAASFCMTLPNRNYGPPGGSVSLMVDQKSMPYSSGGTSIPGCFEFEFPISAGELDQAQHVAVSIEQVRILGGVPNPDATCNEARAALLSQYPDLDFQCSFSMAGYYTDLRVPDGMTREEAQQIIMDAIEGAIYGPWELTIR